MLFIDLTEMTKNGAKAICVNVGNIQTIQKGDRSKDTLIIMVNKTYYFVQESVAEIKKLIGRG